MAYLLYRSRLGFLQPCYSGPVYGRLGVGVIRLLRARVGLVPFDDVRYVVAHPSFSIFFRAITGLDDLDNLPYFKRVISAGL